MDLFVLGAFRSHSGAVLPYKIEADAFSDATIEAFAYIVAQTYVFRRVHSVPRGGDRLARALEAYKGKEGVELLVDDVLTTGGSMERRRREIRTDYPVQGIVIIARGDCPAWISPILEVSRMARL